MPKKVSVVEKIYDANDQLALENLAKLDEAGVLTLNLMASPGAGKTSLIERTLEALRDRFKIAVIDGDIASSIDADRAAAAGATAVQINTGGSCHLDANMLRNALAELDLEEFDLLIVENVGNLICPAGFKIGAHKNILIASTPEGDDKPYKYPTMYQNVDVLLINKIDLLPLLSFDMDYFKRGVKILSPGLITYPLSCQTGEGFETWLNWLISAIEEV
ncbi:MAG: hydrogenase nickel incorporation protein HypB [Chloroflexota bacterium]|nr:hydrogenase nickel incorporation protein HypB [Chloroflexota bacterium]